MSLHFVLWHIGIGALLSAGFVAALLHTDLHGIGTLLLRAPEHPFPLLLLWFFLGLTFASVQLGTAIMLHFREEP
ncbi:hypothetical protein [Roseococcus suduntuyensis]|uniref:Tetrahydromethanopterin S-methyltransferase subunit E n=1 Tax=Roseococcus suduntuyensis TaxID=455361 RepID=A0A840A6Q0_9PROT|nr:hypothetical protein [Roseococcus suduntuyensis]MBB3896911.1 tetrahydromethanopterin S-methyltransferase subunit E [Roseococcus suduntuyensis]